MSFPKVPDIDPKIDISLCDAVNLLLTSIAMEEISLSRLMDAEHDKIESILALCREKSCTPGDVLLVNKSADSMLRDVIKLEMLLQFKQENICGLVPCTTTQTTTTTSTTTTTTCSAACPPCCGCCLMGTGSGCVSNGGDPLCGQRASLHAFFPCGAGERSLRYRVGGGGESLHFYAAGREAEAGGVNCREGMFAARGTGTLTRSCLEGAEQKEQAAYALRVRTGPCGQLAFHVRIFSGCGACIFHDSGWIPSAGRGADLCMGTCP